MRERMEAFVYALQAHIVGELERVDGTQFRRDSWTRPQGGGGLSCVCQSGNVFEKAGVNVSVVYGELSPEAGRQMRSRGMVPGSVVLRDDGRQPFFATGISMVLHPANPMAPTVHLNYRYFELMDDARSPLVWWFGGGTAILILVFEVNHER